MRKFAISDIHGCRKSFEALLDKIAFAQSDELYLLGDYIDRGPDSKGVIDFIWRLQESDYQVYCLKGNHEELMLTAFEDDEDYKMNHWLMNGGVPTIQSFVTEDGKPDIPDAYFKFAESLEYYFEVDEFILVHAGLNFKIPNPLTDEVSMLWIRDWYERIDQKWLGDRVIVHGHTPIAKEEIESQFVKLKKMPALDIDAGCVYAGKRPGMGYLCAFDLSDRVLHFQKNVED